MSTQLQYVGAVTENRFTDYGFVWGPVEVTRLAEIRGIRAMAVETPYRRLEIAVSPTGRSVRVYRDGVELVEKVAE